MLAHQFPTPLNGVSMEETIRGNPWEKFNQKDEPTFYLATRYRWRWREEDAFWRASGPMVRYLWDEAYPKLPAHHTAVALGVGIGRLAVTIGRRFLRVVIVDPSLVTSQRLRDTCQRFGVCNVEPIRDVESWEEEPANLICSVLFFPHINDLVVIEEYVNKIARCLQGIALLHFDTTPKTRMEKFAERLPVRHSQGLSRHPEKRSRYDAATLRTMFTQHGLRVEDEANPHSPHHVFVLRSATVAR